MRNADGCIIQELAPGKGQLVIFERLRYTGLWAYRLHEINRNSGMIFLMVGVIERRAILRQYIAAALPLNRDALAGPKPGYNNQVSR